MFKIFHQNFPQIFCFKIFSSDFFCNLSHRQFFWWCLYVCLLDIDGWMDGWWSPGFHSFIQKRIFSVSSKMEAGFFAHTGLVLLLGLCCVKGLIKGWQRCCLPSKRARVIVVAWAVNLLGPWLGKRSHLGGVTRQLHAWATRPLYVCVWERKSSDLYGERGTHLQAHAPWERGKWCNFK